MERLPDGSVLFLHFDQDVVGGPSRVVDSFVVPAHLWVDGVTHVSAPARLEGDRQNRRMVRLEVDRIHHGPGHRPKDDP